MHIRQAEIDDAEELARILNSIIAEGGKTAIDTPLSGPELAEWFITGPHCISCLLADTDEGFLGFQALERFHADLPHDMADIATFVTDRARGSGIGRSLSHATAAIAGENGVQRIRAVIPGMIQQLPACCQRVCTYRTSKLRSRRLMKLDCQLRPSLLVPNPNIHLRIHFTCTCSPSSIPILAISPPFDS